MKSRWLRAVALLTGTVAFVAAVPAWCQPYPAKPVRLIIGGLPGTAPDVIARLMHPHVSESLGQSLIIDNRGGGAGILGAQIVATAPGDGYTMLMIGGAGLTIIPFLTKKPPYDPFRDFTPVTLVTIAPLVLACNPSLPVKSVNELISLSKARPKEVLFGTPGVGSIHHLAVEMFNQAAGITLGHVPYKGGPPAVMDAISGRVQLVITTVIPVQPHLKASKLRALAVTSAKRVGVYPDVPTVSESGLDGYEALQWFALFAPKDTPAAVRERVVSEVRKAAQIPNVASVLTQEGQEIAVNGPQALAEFQRSEIAKWKKVIGLLRESGIVLE
jgi:tripartite-type tricarboxylate transporter receptor subunit TctC